jgi:hypothetical protein
MAVAPAASSETSRRSIITYRASCGKHAFALLITE